LDDRAFADRLVNYADALTAVTFVGSSGLSVSLTDPDVRCSLINAVGSVAIGYFAMAAIVSVLLVILRRWELDLRSQEPLTRKSSLYSRRLQLARLVVVWVSSGMAVLLLAYATHDPRCPS